MTSSDLLGPPRKPHRGLEIHIESQQNPIHKQNPNEILVKSKWARHTRNPCSALASRPADLAKASQGPAVRMDLQKPTVYLRAPRIQLASWTRLSSLAR